MFKKILIANRGEIACRVIKTARKILPKDAYLHLLLGIALTQLGRESEAEPHLIRGQGASPSVTDPWSRKASKPRTHEHELLARGKAMEAKGDWSGAIRAYREIIENRPGEIRLPLKLARTLLKAGRDEEALQLAVKTLEQSPSHLELLLFYGALLSKKGDLQGAWNACNRALSAAPDRPGAYIFKSTLLAKEKKFPEAIAAAETAVEKAPADSRVYEVMARHYAAMQKPWEAVRVLENGLAQTNLNPSKRLFQMLIEGLKAIKRTDKIPAVLKQAQDIYGTKAFPSQS